MKCPSNSHLNFIPKNSLLIPAKNFLFKQKTVKISSELVKMSPNFMLAKQLKRTRFEYEGAWKQYNLYLCNRVHETLISFKWAFYAKLSEKKWALDAKTWALVSIAAFPPIFILINCLLRMAKCLLNSSFFAIIHGS